MGKNDDVYIGSMSPTIEVKEHRALVQVARQINPLLTKSEFTRIMAVYGEAIDRVLKENGMEEEKLETKIIKQKHR